MAIMITTSDSTSFAPWTGFTVFLVYVAVLLAIALVLFRRRDA
jgi:ABC-type transport system involved in multi-copper enzyme maturation permease subunit